MDFGPVKATNMKGNKKITLCLDGGAAGDEEEGCGEDL